MTAVRLIRCALLSCALTTLADCALAPERDLLLSTDQDTATVQGFEHARTWADGSLDAFKASIMSPRLAPTRNHEVNYLAISAGGAAGAFTAGVLNGWTAAGNRPEFDMVSGVSIGALIAPFAFLGPAYDPALKSVFTEANTNGLASIQNPIKMLANGGLMDVQPLAELIDRYADARMLAAIAEEHRKGRRLLVATTNLDAQRPVVWNLGSIAASGRPDALFIFRNVLLASASVPGVYPPVLIDAKGNGREFKEMHVDGATTEEVFIAPELLNLKAATSKGGHRHIWVIVNNTLAPEFVVTKVGPLAIASRSISTLSKSQTIWVVRAAQEKAERDGIDFNVATIDRAVPYDNAKPFAPDYIAAVYRIGIDGVANRSLWHKTLGPFDHSTVASSDTSAAH